MDATQINNTLNTLSNKITHLEKSLTSNETVINAHPVAFIILLILFFITMDIWATATHYTIRKLHPTGHLQYWEYIILGFIALAIVLGFAHLSGIKIRMLQE